MHRDLFGAHLFTYPVVSALAVAVQLIDSATQNKAGKPLKYDRRIIVVTDGRGEIDDGDLDEIIDGLITDDQARKMAEF